METGWISWLPEAASTVAGKVDALYFYLSGVTLFFTLLISGVLIFFVVRYRRRSPFEIPRPVAGSHKLETVWTVIPFVIAMSFFIWGTHVYFEQARVPKVATEVYVVGKQWMWKLQHSTGQREINELHVPKGRKVRLIMTSEDTIHSFFMPEFRIKADVLPGRYTDLWFEATKTGTFHLFCAEYCGMNHSGMIGSIIVMEPKEFDNWLTGNAGNQTPAVAGQQLFQSLGCASCHGVNGEGGRGPTLAGLFGRQTPLTNGQSVNADEAYIRESIVNPQAKIVTGFTPIMPTFQGQISEDQILQLMAFIKSLQIVNPQQPLPAASPVSTAAQPRPTPAQNKNSGNCMRAIEGFEPPSPSKVNYINAQYGLKSWLLTKDHKRIGLLYLASVTLFFFIGGIYAMMVRIELLTPRGDFLSSATYNKVFTQHGIIMIFFFLIPSIPATLGNFLVPMMIGAKDLAFPRINLLSWYIYLIAGIITIYALLAGGIDTGWTFYAPYSTTFSNSYVVLTGLGIFINGFSSILTGLNFIVTIHTMRAPGMTWFRLPLFIWAHYATSLIMVLGTPVIAITVLLLAFERLARIGIFDPAIGGDPVLFQHLFWFYSHPAVYIMVLPGNGRHERIDRKLLTQEYFWLQVRRILKYGHRSIRLSGLGSSHVCLRPVGLCRNDLFLPEFRGGDSIRSKSFQLDSDALQRLDFIRHTDALCARLHRTFHDWRNDRIVSCDNRRRRSRP